MTVEAILTRLEAVTSRGAGRWLARCPVLGHGQGRGDRSPSLSVGEGERGILVRCWAGCRVEEITAALGLCVADLFADALTSPRTRQPAQPRPRRYDFRRPAALFEDRVLDLWFRSERTLDAARGLDSADWSDEDRDAALLAVARVYADLEWARALESVVFELRCRGLAA